MFSLQFAKTEIVYSELYYIEQMSGKKYKPTREGFQENFSKHGIPFGPNTELIGEAFSIGRYFYETGDMLSATYFFEVVMGFVDDEKVKELYDDAKKRSEQ